MAVNNFYVTTRADGAATRQESTPRNKAGGFVTTVKARSNGSPLNAVEIHALARDDGTLIIRVTPHADARNSAFGDVLIEANEAGGFTITTRR